MMDVAYLEPRSGQIPQYTSSSIHFQCVSYVLALLQCKIPEFKAVDRSYPASLARLEFKV